MFRRRIYMRDIERTQCTGLAQKSWWNERTPLEKIGLAAIGIAGGAIAAAVVFPHAVAAAGDGAFTATAGCSSRERSKGD
jgi:hypothetical protein